MLFGVSGQWVGPYMVKCLLLTPGVGLHSPGLDPLGWEGKTGLLIGRFEVVVIC